MDVWAVLKNRVGDTIERLILCGKFALEGDSSHPQGPTRIFSSYMLDGNTYLGDQVYGGSLMNSEKVVYWLPWRNLAITSVTIRELNASGCDYFLTSTFSGCRFVVTEEKVAHVAWAQPEGSDSLSRDLSEWTNLHGERIPLLRRKLSISGENYLDMGALTTSRATYGVGVGGDGIDPGRAVVIGYRTGVSWQFKAVIFNDRGAYWYAFI